MILMMVDLPEPFSPARQWISPRRTISETLSRARIPANRLLTCRNSIRPSAMRVKTRTSRKQGGGRCGSPLPVFTGRGTHGVSEVVVAHIGAGDADPAGAVEQRRLGSVRNQQTGVAGQTEIEAGFDIGLLLLQHHHGQLVHGVARGGRIPELDVIHV